MPTDTNVDTIIINKMTQAQYDALTAKKPTEIYVITDAPATNVETTAVSTGYGVHGDYGMHYGIIDSPYGLITQGAGNQLKIAAGIQLCVPGADSYITLGSATTYEAGASETFTLFYARGANGVGATFLEATDVVWSEVEPEPNGQTGYQAWWNPAHGVWQMRSNDTGNVWRDIVGCPLCDCKVTDGNITRVDFIGYRVLNKQPSVPMLPTDDGSYVLKCVVSNGTTTLQWVTEA